MTRIIRHGPNAGNNLAASNVLSMVIRSYSGALPRDTGTPSRYFRRLRVHMVSIQKAYSFLIPLVFSVLAHQVRGQCTAQALPATATVCGGVPLALSGAGTGQPPLNYQWSGSPYLSSTNTANTTFDHPVPVASTQTITLTLTVTDNAGCVNTAQVSVTVNATPLAALSTSDTNPDLNVGTNTYALCGTGLSSYSFQFNDASVALPGAGYSVDWGTPPTPFIPAAGGWTANHTYGIGLNTITYTVTNPGPGGCAHSAEVEVYIGSNPQVGTGNPGNTVVCSGADLTFPINAANNTPGTVYAIDWGDGNGTSFTHPPPPSVTYAYPNTNCPGAPYIFRVDATNPCPIPSFSTAGPIFIIDTPQASFTMSTDTACQNSSITFTNTSLGVGGPSCNQPLRVWSISPAGGYVLPAGMGSTNGSTAVNTWTNGANSISVQFTQPGNYCITLQVGNTACGTDEVVQCVCIEAPPVPAFTLTPATGCAPFTGVVTNTSTSANSCLTTFGWNVTTSGGACGSGPAWNTVGGTSTSSFEPQFQFTQAGNYAIQLQAQNSCGTFLGTMNVVANAPPQVDVSGLAGICATQCVNPSAVVQNCGTPISTYAWTFPGGAPANSNLALPPQVCYANATSSAISLTVTNACGSATDVTTLAVGSLPTMPVISSNSPVCAGQTLSLTASTLPGMTYAWTGPNGFTSNMPSVTIPNASAANAGTYSVVAISSGCSGPAATVNVQVNAAPTITVTPSSAAICNGQSASFTASGAGNYQWFIGSTLVGTGPLFNTSPAISTAFTVSGSSGGCPGSTTVPVTVFPVTNVNAGPDQTFCDQAIGVQLGAFPSLGTWSGANVSPSGVFTPVPGQLGPVTLTYTHVDGNGCPNSDQVVISVQALTQIAYAGPDTFFCQSNTPVILPASPPGGSWIGAGGNGAFTPGVAGSFTATYFYGTGTCVTSDVVQIQVLPVPQLVMPANFARCLNAAPVPLSASPTGGVWSGPGVSGPPFFFDPAGVGVGLYAPAYTYTDGSGCTSTGQILVTVDPIPVVNAGPDMTLCDQPVPVQLIGTPAGGTWTGNTLPITPDGIFVPTGIGSDVFTYTFTNAAGCSGSDQAAVSIVAIDQPAYAGNDTSVCVNSGTLQLAGLPFGGVWSGPQVSTGGAFNTTVAGQFTLTYSYGSATCLVQDQVSVVVNALPVVDAGEEIATCLDGGLQVLIATPAGGTWTGAGVDATGIFDPLLAMPGGNPVTYTYTDPLSGCTNNAVALVTVNPLPTAAFSNDPVGCVNSAFPFTNTSAGASTFEWAFGDGSVSAGVSPTHTYFSESIFTVQLIAVSGAGCRDTITGVVDVRSVPQADLALSIDTGCGPLEVAFTNNSIGQGLSFAWNFGGLDSSTDVDPQPYLFPPDPVQGVTYPITLTATNSCGVDVALSSVTVIPPPTALFGPNVNSYCSFADVPFGNASFGSPEDFLWDFGNGTTSTDPGPVVTQAYEAVDVPLVINVTLTASNQCGSDMAVQSVTILPNQVNAFFNADPINGCSPVTVELTQFSTGDTTYYWDLGDGNVSTQHDLTHTYIQPGTYTIELFAYGCGFDSYSTEITVFPSPEVAFSISPPSACAGVPFNFLSTTPDVAGLQWDFGDGTGSTLTAPQHTYSQGGLFPVTLTATLIGNGCQASLTQQVLVNTAPLAAFGTLPVSGCVPLDVAFQNSSVGSDINQWSFGDGNTSVLPSPFHTYTTAGSFTIQLVAENLSGCTDTAYTTVVAHPLPTSAFTLSQYETCDTLATVQTMNASQGASGFSWDLGNGATSTLNQPMATYSAPGTYTIVLTAVNQYGCEAESSGTFVQYPAPVAQFSSSPQPGCAGYPVEFLNTSLHGTGFLWDLGDGATTTATFPMHTYATAGTYPVQLIVHGAGGCSDTLAVPGAVIIHPRPLAAYTTDTVASIPHAMHFRNQSEGAISFTWDFDDGDGSTAIHPLHVFPADGGGFTVCLVAVNEFGCPDTVCSYINLPGDPGIFAPNAFTPNGDTRNDVFLPILNGFVGWNYRLLVFDRWGLPAFDTRSRSEGWDGTRNGAESPVDVYVWKVIVERDGDARDFVGHVTLLR